MTTFSVLIKLVFDLVIEILGKYLNLFYSATQIIMIIIVGLIFTSFATQIIVLILFVILILFNLITSSSLIIIVILIFVNIPSPFLIHRAAFVSPASLRYLHERQAFDRILSL